MFIAMKEAVRCFVDSIEAYIDDCKEEKIEGFVSKISIRGDENYDVYVVIPYEKLIYMSRYYFGEDECDSKDLTNEIANLIIGNAKIIAAEKRNINFNISTPQFLGEFKDIKKAIKYDEKLSFRFNGDKCFFILFKKVTN
ncbi:MAG TPA: hypothetical protein EYH54_00230 [Nautiliaceae bacterium]|nr:hypothetical protein [Nautiliaceae bacterium]